MQKLILLFSVIFLSCSGSLYATESDTTRLLDTVTKKIEALESGKTKKDLKKLDEIRSQLLSVPHNDLEYSRAMSLTDRYIKLTSQLNKSENQKAFKKMTPCERKGGVNVGMTKEEVTESCWGKPRSKNITQNQYGTHEQWVYGGGYLYFDNERLTTIQTFE